MGIQLAPRDRHVNFRPGIAGHELGLFQIEQIGDHAPGDIDWMPDGVGAYSETAGSAQFIEGIQSQVRLAVEDLGITGIRRSKVNELIQIIVAAGEA